MGATRIEEKLIESWMIEAKGSLEAFAFSLYLLVRLEVTAVSSKGAQAGGSIIVWTYTHGRGGSCGRTSRTLLGTEDSVS